MRFKAEISNPPQFSRLITSLAPLSKIATLKLKEDAVHFICMGDGTKSGIQVWRCADCDAIFRAGSLRLESNHMNEIYLEVTTDALAKALRSASGATQVTIKLAKKGGVDNSGTGEGSYPVLSLAIESSSRLGKRLEITQDVAVRVKKAADIELLKEPLSGNAIQVILLLPPLQLLRTVVERLKTVSPYLTLSANNAGELRIRAEADEANVETEWRGLKKPSMGAEDVAAQHEDPRQFFSVTLEAKSLLKFLASYTVATTSIFCLCASHCAIFYVYIGATAKDQQRRARGGGGAGDEDDMASSGGVLTFFVPAVKLDGDE
ncbi:hypothetical protein Rhopal_003460-T1 [Rhodotorula paludigena]|uniref:Checkpoint protein n=1 Tax=Rhodotorula paludigena TaxID=86838 RepID=A0AAV5GKK3_9BASI|nr:hypothetical protein Rhopal_003460-T1 [Rhodotorula paludigena]